MKFKSNSRRRAIEYEKDIVKFWQDNHIFEKSVQNRDESNSYVFYDGPPFITGNPHHGTLLSSIVKDAIPRYQTMKGKRVERRWGWDCHGLPAENFVEKKLGVTDRHDIGTKISLEDYIKTARESMVATSGTWEGTINRIGRWVDFKGAYKTMDKDYMESVWWAFKQLYDKGKIYEGERVLMYDTKWATPLSKAEVTMDTGAYQEVTDPSVYVKFKLADSDAYLLAWTTTPWTLPGNVALAINQDIEYVKVKLGDEYLILAADTIDKVLTDEKHQALEYEVVEKIDAKNLIGLNYEPIFDKQADGVHMIYSADYVTTESGTGIVHIAPAYGEDDFELAVKYDLPVVHVLDDYGKYLDGEWQGEYIWDINKTIAKTLHERGVVWKIDYIRHEYPHNPRTGERLIYRAHPSWFMDIQGQKTEMLEQNSAGINWFPEHIKHGRFEKNIEQAPDWNLSRDRFWATAMPVWKGDRGTVKVVGSYDELKDLSGVELDDYHRPWVDDISFEIDGEKFNRIDKVLDCWFESGSMPFAQFHYPFENKTKFETNFPADFIVEYVGQVRAWFYYIHAVNVALFGHSAFKNVIVTGNVTGNDGRKMSKSYGNFTDPNQLMDKFSADSLRFLLLSSPLLNGEDFALHDKEVGDVARKLSMVWNMYDFFTMYAEVDNFTFPYPTSSADAFLIHGMSNTNHSDTPASSYDKENEKLSIEADLTKLSDPLDKWIVSRVHQLINEVEVNMDKYDIPNALKPVLPFIDDASNWYVRRNRRRFWKEGETEDKNNAYRTLHYVLVKLSQVLAPFTPFLAEELYKKLTGGESVHLLDWPTSGEVDEVLVEEMAVLRDYVNKGLSLRAQNQIKVRQPLASVTIKTNGQFVDFEPILIEELNVKEVKYDDEFNLETEITPELKQEGIAREVIRHIQTSRKQAGLNIDDRIKLSLISDSEAINQAIASYEGLIKSESLATKLSTEDSYEHSFDIKVDGEELQISLEK